MINKILVVDDIAVNRDILVENFSDSYEVLEAANGKEAWDILMENDDIAAVLLDLMMPVMNGIEVLTEMKKMGLLSRIPVFVVTAETDSKSLTQAYMLGAVDVITKPFNTDFIRNRIGNVIELYNRRNSLEDTVAEQHLQIDIMNINLIEMLAYIIEYKDREPDGTEMNKICSFTRILLRKICELYPEYNMEYEQILKIANAAILHDIGKFAIPDSILFKPGKLTEEEFRIMKTHSNRGYVVLKKFPDVMDAETHAYACDICLHHHERWDGNGYPEGLKGDEISIGAQVVSLVDVFTALTSPRVYKQVYSPEQAQKMINDGECGQFNPKLLKAFNSCFSILSGGLC